MLLRQQDKVGILLLIILMGERDDGLINVQFYINFSEYIEVAFTISPK
jgi:hypothetical protein